jgi:hypothetical protein
VLRPLSLLVAFPLLAAGLFAQGDLLKKAPPGVEDALRERIKGFYDLVQAKKYRASESFVCEGSKDDYYNANKNVFDAYEIINITWEDDFSTARAAIVFDTDLATRAGKIPVKMPMTPMWKLEAGKWCYYLAPPSKTGVVSPFGVMHAGPEPPENQRMPPLGKAVDPNSLFRQIEAVPSAIHFKSYQNGTETVDIRNGLDGSIGLELSADVTHPGITFSLDPKQIGGKEHAVLTVKFETTDRKPKNPFKIRILITPLNHILEIPVTFALAPEDESKIPEKYRPKP